MTVMNSSPVTVWLLLGSTLLIPFASAKTTVDEKPTITRTNDKDMDAKEQAKIEDVSRKPEKKCEIDPMDPTVYSKCMKRQEVRHGDTANSVKQVKAQQDFCEKDPVNPMKCQYAERPVIFVPSPITDNTIKQVLHNIFDELGVDIHGNQSFVREATVSRSADDLTVIAQFMNGEDIAPEKVVHALRGLIVKMDVPNNSEDITKLRKFLNWFTPENPGAVTLVMSMVQLGAIIIATVFPSTRTLIGSFLLGVILLGSFYAEYNKQYTMAISKHIATQTKLTDKACEPLSLLGSLFNWFVGPLKDPCSKYIESQQMNAFYEVNLVNVAMTVLIDGILLAPFPLIAANIKRSFINLNDELPVLAAPWVNGFVVFLYALLSIFVLVWMILHKTSEISMFYGLISMKTRAPISADCQTIQQNDIAPKHSSFTSEQIPEKSLVSETFVKKGDGKTVKEEMKYDAE